MHQSEELQKQLLEYFIQKDQIPKDKLLNIKQEKNLDFLEAELIATGKISEEDIAKAKASLFNLPHIILSDQKISSDILDILPEELAENYQMVVFSKKDNVIDIGLVDPLNLKVKEAADFVARGKNFKIRYYFISKTSFNRVMHQYGSLKSEVGEALKIARDKFEAVDGAISGKMERIIKSAPISKMVAVILKHAVESRASDVHIEPTLEDTRVRYRIDGKLQTSLVLPKYVHAAIISRIKVMSILKIDETRIPQDGRIRLNIGGKNIDFRVSTLPLYNQEKVVMRILDTSEGVSTWEELGFEGRNLDSMNNNIARPHGMFLVTGPTGSGKSTTLYAALQILNKEQVNIVTLEDPVEYYLKGVNQSQVRPEVKFTFASGLRSILRQDPDIIMVGEIRDAETAELAIHASLTGHIVLSTLHTNDAFGAIPRLIDMKIEPFLITSTLNVVIAQRLVRTICSQCKEKVKLPASLRDEMEDIFRSIPPKNLPPEIADSKINEMYKGAGCQHCANTGYKGRMAISEVLEINDEIKDVINSGFKLSTIKEMFIKQGMLSLRQDGLIKAIEGKTSAEEILTVTKD
ncbi:MAG: GspE/PulE family protein [Candidatus Kuenenbacteria bacterium]